MKKFFHGFTLAIRHEDGKVKKSEDRKILREAELKIFQTFYVAFLSFLSFALGVTGLRSLANASSSIFIEKVRTFSTLAGISNIDFFKIPDLASLRENVGFA